MKLAKTSIEGVYEAATDTMRDHRGQFARLFCGEDLRRAHLDRPIVQINYSRTLEAGTIRGLHFQGSPRAEAKWVRCLKGRVFDVAVDLRRGSPTFLHWHAIELDPKLMNALFIPEGCAHGFQALAQESELLYLHTESYCPASEGGVRFDDPRLAIKWPLPAANLSERDSSYALITDSFQGISI